MTVNTQQNPQAKPKKTWRTPSMQEMGNLSQYVQTSPAKSGAFTDGMAGGTFEFKMTM
jgi:hypothetical protein